MAASVIVKGVAISAPLQSACNGSFAMQNHRGCSSSVAIVVPAMAGSSFPARISRGVACSALRVEGAAETYSCGDGSLGRRDALLWSGMTALIGGTSFAGPAFADFDEDYKSETQAVIERVKTTLALEKTDPTKADAVATLRQTSNDWVAKYRREKSVAGRPSFSNMYSVLNAISGHFISFGPNYPIPGKRKDRILEEIRDAEKALKRGR